MQYTHQGNHKKDAAQAVNFYFFFLNQILK